MKNAPNLSRYVPILSWGKTYNGLSLTNDLVVAAAITIMLIPQSLAYAMLAGLPPQMGPYASILPVTLYAAFGTSRALVVGPVAVVSLLTAASISTIAAPGSEHYFSRHYPGLSVKGITSHDGVSSFGVYGKLLIPPGHCCLRYNNCC